MILSATGGPMKFSGALYNYITVYVQMWCIYTCNAIQNFIALAVKWLKPGALPCRCVLPEARTINVLARMAMLQFLIFLETVSKIQHPF